VIQRRRWVFFWTDWYPVDNAVRALQQEFIDHYDRMQEILVELKDAEAYVKSSQTALESGDMRKGIGPVFKDQFIAQETLKPDVSARFKEVQEKVTQGQGRQRPGGGSRTMFIGPTSGRFDVKSLNREAVGEEFNADHVIGYRAPQHDNQRKNSKGNDQRQNQDKGHQS
jgi:hypothetical protein